MTYCGVINSAVCKLTIKKQMNLTDVCFVFQERIEKITRRAEKALTAIKSDKKV